MQSCASVCDRSTQCNAAVPQDISVHLSSAALPAQVLGRASGHPLAGPGTCGHQFCRAFVLLFTLAHHSGTSEISHSFELICVETLFSVLNSVQPRAWACCSDALKNACPAVAIYCWTTISSRHERLLMLSNCYYCCIWSEAGEC